MNGAKTGEERTAVQRSEEAEGDEHNPDPHTNAKTQLRQPADEMKAKQKDQRTCNRSQQGAILPQELPDRARRRSESDEHRGKTHNESEGRAEQTRPRCLSLAQFFHSNSRQHRDVAGHKRQNARREEGYETCQKCSEYRNVSHSSSLERNPNPYDLVRVTKDSCSSRLICSALPTGLPPNRCGSEGKRHSPPSPPLSKSVCELVVSYFNIFTSSTVIVAFSESVTPLIWT